jgi:hypothetical protein
VSSLMTDLAIVFMLINQYLNQMLNETEIDLKFY